MILKNFYRADAAIVPATKALCDNLVTLEMLADEALGAAILKMTNAASSTHAERSYGVSNEAAKAALERLKAESVRRAG